MSALREIIASFGFEVDDKNLKKGEKRAEGFKGTLLDLGKTLVGAFAIERLAEFTKSIFDSADVLAKQSIALGVSAAELQGWQFAAQLSGSSAEEFNSAFTKFNKNVADASNGAGPAADALKALGVSIKDSTGKMGQPIELLDGVADGLIAMQDPAKRTQTIMALFGKSGAKLLPLFLEGADGIAKLRAEVKDLGAEFDESFLNDAQEVNDNVDRMKLGFKGLAIQALKPILPLLTDFTKGAIGIIKSIIPMIANSNVAKAALVSFGIAGAGALLPLLLEIAPLVLGFLALEDALTFLTGGKSLIGDWVEANFGPGSQKKVQEFFAAIKDSGIADIGATFKAVFGIFTDGKPLTAKFQELAKYISGTMGPQLQKDFGDVGGALTIWAETLTGILKTISQIVDAMKWVAEHTIAAVGDEAFKSQNAASDDAARNMALLRANPKKRATAADFSMDNKPWYVRAAGMLTGFDPQQAADLANSGADKAAASLVPHAAAPRQELQQTNTTNIVQNFSADTPTEAGKKAAEGAKAGVAAGVNDRAMRALVPVAG